MNFVLMLLKSGWHLFHTLHHLLLLVSVTYLSALFWKKLWMADSVGGPLPILHSYFDPAEFPIDLLTEYEMVLHVFVVLLLVLGIVKILFVRFHLIERFTELPNSHQRPGWDE